MEVEMVGERIERELNELEEAERTGVRFFRAVQGARIGEFLRGVRGARWC